MSDWRQDAACKKLFLLDDWEIVGRTRNEIDIANTRKVHDIFFPVQGDLEGAKEAMRICNEECEVRDQCLRQALDGEEKIGIWGGTSGRTRRRLSRMRSIVSMTMKMQSEEIITIEELSNEEEVLDEFGNSFDIMSDEDNRVDIGDVDGES